MYLRDVQRAVDEARQTQLAIENQARELARLLVGNLRNVTMRDSYYDHDLLKKLKRELTQYDANKRRWKS